MTGIWIKTIYIQGVKNNVYNVSGMVEEVKTNTFFIWQNFGLCIVLPLDGLMGEWLDFRHNTHRLVLFVLLCLQQVERVITVSTKTCYHKYSKYVRLLSILVPQHTCNVETCLRLYYMAVSICCTALDTTHTSQMAEYTLNSLRMGIQKTHVCKLVQSVLSHLWCITCVQ